MNAPAVKNKIPLDRYMYVLYDLNIYNLINET